MALLLEVYYTSTYSVNVIDATWQLTNTVTNARSKCMKYIFTKLVPCHINGPISTTLIHSEQLVVCLITKLLLQWDCLIVLLDADSVSMRFGAVWLEIFWRWPEHWCLRALIRYSIPNEVEEVGIASLIRDNVLNGLSEKRKAHWSKANCPVNKNSSIGDLAEKFETIGIFYSSSLTAKRILLWFLTDLYFVEDWSINCYENVSNAARTAITLPNFHLMHLFPMVIENNHTNWEYCKRSKHAFTALTIVVFLEIKGFARIGSINLISFWYALL